MPTLQEGTFTQPASSLQANQTYEFVFDAKEYNTVSFTINNFLFQQSHFSLNDRLGIQVSNDNITYKNIQNIPFLQRSSDDNPPYSDNFYNMQLYNDNGSYGDDGYILPNSPSVVTTDFNFSNDTFPYTVETGHRYVKFIYFWNGISSNGDPATWNISIHSTIGEHPVVDTSPSVFYSKRRYLENKTKHCSINKPSNEKFHLNSAGSSSLRIMDLKYQHLLKRRR